MEEEKKSKPKGDEDEKLAKKKDEKKVTADKYIEGQNKKMICEYISLDDKKLLKKPKFDEDLMKKQKTKSKGAKSKMTRTDDRTS